MMKTKQYLSILLLSFLGMVGFSACSDDDFLFDENGVCYSKNVQHITAAQFQHIVEGYGWQEVSTHEIYSNGKMEKKDYWSYMVGGSSRTMEVLKDGKLKEYYSFMPGQSGYHLRSYFFDEESNRLHIQNNFSTRYIQVLSAGKTQFTVIQEYGICSDGSKVYVYSVYRRMTDEQLQHYHDRYTTNLDAEKETGMN